MKKIIMLLTLAVFNICLSYAAVRTVSNHPAGGALYSNLEAAYNNSSNGDTLLIEGTDIPYFLPGCPAAPWVKSLTVIGIGFNPDKQIPKRAKIGTQGCASTFDFLITGSGSGSSFYGIEFTSGVGTSTTTALNNIVFEDCKFNVDFNFICTPTTNFAFRNCIFDGDNNANLLFGQCGTSATGIISNCVFDGYVSGNNSPLTAVVFEHCLFLSTTALPFTGVHYAIIKNNIFMNLFPDGTFYSTYENNLCRVAGTFPPSPANGNTASGNIEATDPLFVNTPAGSLYNTSHDYHLQAGSAAVGTGSDGTDLGVHGGFTGFSESGEVLINPIIRSMNILNTSVASNGTLNVQIHATKPDND